MTILIFSDSHNGWRSNFYPTILMEDKNLISIHCGNQKKSKWPLWVQYGHNGHYGVPFIMGYTQSTYYALSTLRDFNFYVNILNRQ